MSSFNYGITFTPQGVIIAEPDDVLQAMKQLWVDAFATRNKVINMSNYTPQGQVAVSMAAIVNQKNIDILTLINNFDIAKAQGIYLDFIFKIFGLERKPAQPTIVQCVCTGIAGTVINGKDESVPSLASDNSGNVYVASTTTTIPAGGTVTMQFENQVGGAIPCQANTLVNITTTQAGWDTINNPSDGVTGSNEESDDDFLARYQDLVQQNAGGTIGALQTAVRALDGVLDAFGAQNNLPNTASIYGYTLQPNSYVISVLGGADADIGLAILLKMSMATQNGETTVTVNDPVNNVPYEVKFVRPTELSYFFNIQVANSSNLPADIIDKIKDAVYNDFYNNRVRIASTVYASRFITAINNALGSINIASLTMASQPDGGTQSSFGNSVSCKLDQYPSLDKENIAVSFV